MKALIQKYAEKYGLDPAIVYGVCMTESSLNPMAVRREPGYRWIYKVGEFAKKTGITPALELQQQKTSWGLMQVMGAVLRELGYVGIISEILYDVDKQLDYGCLHLSSNKIKKYGKTLGILAYNSGSPRKNKAGEYVNATYLQKVLRYSKGWADDC